MIENMFGSICCNCLEWCCCTDVAVGFMSECVHSLVVALIMDVLRLQWRMRPMRRLRKSSMVLNQWFDAEPLAFQV